MSFEIHFATRASRDLVRILTELGRRNPDWEDAVASAITEKLEFLAETPYLSTIFRSDRWIEIREVLATSYRIFFTIEEEDQIVHLKRIQHVRQQDPDFTE